MSEIAMKKNNKKSVCGYHYQVEQNSKDIEELKDDMKSGMKEIRARIDGIMVLLIGGTVLTIMTSILLKIFVK